MDKLIIFNLILIAIIAGIIYIQKYVKEKKIQNIILLCVSLVTIAVHYSSFFYFWIKDGSHIEYLVSNPNLVYPIYPCNIVMWSALIYALLRNKESKFGKYLADYLFWFGLISNLVGMFANVDFIMNPTLKNFDVTKSILAHATLLLNVLLLPVYGHIKINLIDNLKHIFISVIVMFVIGFYGNILCTVMGSKEYAYNINSMFLIHSPFDGVPFLKYPFISLVALLFYFVVLNICELFVYKKEERWYNRISFRGNK